MKNKNKFNLILFLPCLIAGFFVFVENSFAKNSSIKINEFLYYAKASGDTGQEWIEIYNAGKADIDMTGYDLYPAGIGYYTFPSFTLLPQAHVVVHLRKYEIDTQTDLYQGNSPKTNMSNTAGSIALFNSKTHSEKTILDFVEYGKDKQTWESYALKANIWNPDGFIKNISIINHSLELKKDGEDNNLASDWQGSYAPGGTPGTENFTGDDVAPPEIPTEDPEEITELSTDTDTLRINEIFPNPSQKGEANEYIEIYNYGQETIPLENIILLDRNNKECPLKIFGSALASSEYLLVENKKHSECKISVHNSNGKFNLLNSLTQNIFSTVSFNGSAKTDLSYNFDGSNWRWSKFLTPSTENIFNNLPSSETTVPKKIYKNTYSDFSAKGADEDNDKLKYTWDFGDGHKSYLQKTHHKYTKTGDYIVTLKIFDGSEEEVKTFNIEVEKFPALDVNIIGLSPNPAGADTDTEYILLKNATKKKVNLNGWSIATAGKKNFINHPINLDLILKPKQEFKLTHLYSKFSLNNTSAKIELRYPNGKVASKVSYKSPKKSIPDDATYEKIKGGWTWKFPIVPSKNTAPETPTPASNELSTPHTPVKTIEQSIQELETEKNLGKFSPAPEIETKKKIGFSLLNFGLHINTTSAFYETTQISNTDYPKTKDLPAHKHWTVELRDTLFSKTNLFINIFYNNK